MAPENGHSRDSVDHNSKPENTPEERGGEHTENFFHLRLFVSGSTSRSQQAIQNLKYICEEHLQGRYDLEIIDVSKEPGLAKQYQILAVPTLLKELPEPLRKIVGDLSEKEKVLEGLDVQPRNTD